MRFFRSSTCAWRGRRGATASTLLAAAWIFADALSAGATFHIAHISRVMTGVDGTTDVQFVEIVMDAAGQEFVGGSKLIAFAADGTFDHVVMTVPGNVSSGSGRPWIMASNAFAAKAGITPDFAFDSTAGKGLVAQDGMVCWGKPADQTNPDSPGMVDCVSYGNFTGPPNVHTSAPSPIKPFGHGLVRISRTGSSAADFTCEDPALPHNNVPAEGQIAASTPCSGGCGDGIVTPPETCDDGDTVFVRGDFCSADCMAFSCGIPTRLDATQPTTSDALFVLKAAVQASNCDVRVCDVNDSNTVTASDALRILERAVGQPLQLTCPQSP